MKKIDTTHDVDEALQKICSHPIFEKSPRNIRLLKFLVNQAKEGNDVKEHIIGLELFEQNYDPEKNDGKVRVYMYNLRKKLSEYYDAVGTSDAIIFNVEKGQYNLSYGAKSTGDVEASNTVLKLSLTKQHLRVLGIIASVLVLVAFLYPTKNTFVWDNYFKPKAKTICVVADHMMLQQKQVNGNWQPTFISGINSESDLLKYLGKNKKEQIRATDYTMMTKMAPFVIHTLCNWFADNDSRFEVCLESDFKLEEIRNHNIIYVGQNKTMKTSKALFLRNSKQFEIFRDGYTSTKSNEVDTYATTFDDEARVEYAMVSYAPLENGNTAIFLTSNNDIGTLATVRNFTNMDWLEQFYEKMPDGNPYFNALFEVSGLRRTDTSCSLVGLEILNGTL
ncbi:helix-turn-helix domain-containing protein [Saccharicrinis aurantiacus]|uniref:helix-turn-helix domain-containing protein n=1 Tax=Saccharicrinis aurantiacus TaxID=1849719 RepID=UPI00249354AF|nr:helix-turn-helix domain-containing protein [Saccharicrinis aurantiacus]